MSLLNSILLGFLRKRVSGIRYAMENPHTKQYQLFKKLIARGAFTEWGRLYGYESIRNYDDFRNHVPVSSYEQLAPWIERMMKGEQNLLWSSPIHWFSKSSGTTNAKSKFIPVSRESLNETHYKGGKDLIALYASNNPQSRMFSGKGLAIGGTYTRNEHRKSSFHGDVSAVIMANLPVWAEYVRTPSLAVATMSEWEEKIERIAHVTIQEKVTNISGVPTWTIVLLERILQLTGKKHIHEVWPHFEVFFHGAVAFHPYREVFRKFFPDPGIHYVETYNASEGFFALQDRLDADDMMLMVDYGIFYEFIPIEHADEENPVAYTLDQVELGKIYAMVISTNGGLWRYKIGDTVKFTSLKPFRIKISGRTKHFINAFGEELIIENAEQAITAACRESGALMTDFTAAPIYFGDGSRGGHEWVIEFQKAPADMDRFTSCLDRRLKELNSDYEAKRYKDMALQMPVVHVAPVGTFYHWMKKRGKLGGQNKVPRLSNSRDFMDDLLPFMASKERVGMSSTK